MVGTKWESFSFALLSKQCVVNSWMQSLIDISPSRGAVSASEGLLHSGLSVSLSTFSCVHYSAASFCQMNLIFVVHILLRFLDWECI